MIIGSILRAIQTGVGTLAWKSDEHPGKSKTIAIASAVAGTLGISKDASTGLGDILIAVGEMLKAL